MFKARAAKLKPEKLVKYDHIKTLRVSDRIISSRIINKPREIRTGVKKTQLRPEMRKLKSRIVPNRKVQRLTPRMKGQKSITGVVPKVGVQRLRPGPKARRSSPSLRLVRKKF